MELRVFDLQLIPTKDFITGEVNGRFIPIWRDWDSYLEVPPKMVYMTACLPGKIKGPHLHRMRWGYLTCIKGRVVFVIKHQLMNEKGEMNHRYEEIILDASNPQVIEIPPNVPQAHVNIGEEEAIIVNICNPAWHPDNQDNYAAEYDDYDFSRWTDER